MTTDRTVLRRLPERGSNDPHAIAAILDAAVVCHLGFTDNGHPTVVPTGFGRDGDRVFVHGSVASRAMTGDTLDVCLTVTHLDGIVLARSAFHHSFMYRSVMVYGPARRLEDPDERLEALRVITEHIAPGRWEGSRRPTAKELAATSVLELSLAEASAKVRGSGVKDDPEDLVLPHWAGMVPLRLVAGDPQPDDSVAGLPTPQHVRALRHRWDDGSRDADV